MRKIDYPIVMPAVREDVIAMAPHMRAIDVKELWQAAGLRPLDGLMFGFENSQTFTAAIPGQPPILMFGIGKLSILDNARCIWLLATDRQADIKKQFVRESADYLRMIGEGSTVYNHVLPENTLSLRWLKWLGFDILDAKPHGWLQKPFHYVQKVIPKCADSRQHH